MAMRKATGARALQDVKMLRLWLYSYVGVEVGVCMCVCVCARMLVQGHMCIMRLQSSGCHGMRPVHGEQAPPAWHDC